jgi:hypothetical protein
MTEDRGRNGCHRSSVIGPPSSVFGLDKLSLFDVDTLLTGGSEIDRGAPVRGGTVETGAPSSAPIRSFGGLRFYAEKQDFSPP